MQNQAEVDDIKLAYQLRPWTNGDVIQHISLVEPGLQPIPITKQLIAQIDIPLPEISANEVLRGRPVKDQLADVMAETAANVEKYFTRLETGEKAVVEAGAVGEGELEELEGADAGEGEGFPGVVSL